MAETGTLTASVADISGHDPRHGDEPFVNLMILGLTCGAGHARGDGWLVSGEVGDGGLMMRDSTEVDELLYPIVIWADEIVPDSGGPGRFRGAPACYVEYGPADTEIEAMWSTDGYVHAAIGARGGHPGAPARQYLRRADGAVEPLPGWGELRLMPGDTVYATASAGAGYGPPWERALERVFSEMIHCPKPVIHRINGDVVGGANAFHLAADFAIMASTAKLQQVGVGIGSVAGFGPTQWWPQVISDKRARDVLMALKPVTPELA